MSGRKNKRKHHNAQHVRLDTFMLNTAAWLSLSPAAVSLYVVIASRFNGYNNGDIGLSNREAAQRCNINSNTVTRAFCELQEKGFVKLISLGSFNCKTRHSSRWALTAWGIGDKLPTKEYVCWEPEQAPIDSGATVVDLRGRSASLAA